MKNAVQKVSIVFAVVGALALLVGCGGAKSVSNSSDSPVQQQVVQQEKSEKQKAFEEQLSKKEAEFDRKYNEVKSQNDKLREEFDRL